MVFSCSGPWGLRFEGKGADIRVADRGETLVVTVPLADVSTGIGIRDTHMREKYLEIGKYPTAELEVLRSELKFPAEGARVEATASGTMTIHGTPQSITFHYRAQRKGNSYEVQGDVHLNMNDFGIEKPTYLGVTVKPPVDVTVSFGLIEQ
jgi:polyisoprenoid-binding protein YceI